MVRVPQRPTNFYGYRQMGSVELLSAQSPPNSLVALNATRHRLASVVLTTNLDARPPDSHHQIVRRELNYKEVNILSHRIDSHSSYTIACREYGNYTAPSRTTRN